MSSGEAPTFSLRIVAGLIAAGVVTFAAFLVLAAYANDFRSGRDGRAHALSVSAVGFRGLTQLIEGTGGQIGFAREDRGLLTEDLLVVIVPEAGRDEEPLAELLEFRRTKPTLVILPKWVTAPDPLAPGWVGQQGSLPSEAFNELAGAIGSAKIVHKAPKGRNRLSGSEFLEGLVVPAPRVVQSLVARGSMPLLTDRAGNVVLARIGEGPMYLLADPDIMSNHGLRDPRTARAALRILAELNSTGAQSIVFDLTLSGFGQKPSALKLLFEPPFLALTAAIAVAALLAGLHGAFRFGPERREARAIPFGKLALVDNSAGLMRMARREHRAGGAYADLIREAAARASGAPGGLGPAETDSYLDRLTKSGAPFSALAARARSSADASELVSAARALFSWKKEISR